MTRHDHRQRRWPQEGLLGAGEAPLVLALVLVLALGVVLVAESLLGFGLGSAAAAAILDRVFGLPASPRLAAVLDVETGF